LRGAFDTLILLLSENQAKRVKEDKCMKKKKMIGLLVCIGIVCILCVTFRDAIIHVSREVISGGGQAGTEMAEGQGETDTDIDTGEGNSKGAPEEAENTGEAQGGQEAGTQEGETETEENNAGKADGEEDLSDHQEADSTLFTDYKEEAGMLPGQVEEEAAGSQTSATATTLYRELKQCYDIKDAYDRVEEVDRMDREILEFCGDPLAGKKIAFLGDSITAGNGGSPSSEDRGVSYTDFIAQYTSAEIVNLGIGGTPMEGGENDDAIVHRFENIPRDTDIIVLFAGINDMFAGVEHFGTPEDLEEGTYWGDVTQIFEKIRQLYPDADVHVVITYPNEMEEYREYSGETWQRYADVQIELSKRYGYRVINLYEEGFLDSSDFKVRNHFFRDDIHPNDQGSELLGRHILVHLIERYVR